MPVTAIPDSYVSPRIAALQRRIAELERTVGKPTDHIRDTNDDVLTMPGSGNPAIVGRGQDAGLSFSSGVVTVTDEQGRQNRPLVASGFTGPVTGDTTGVHHGDVGTSTETHNHYGDLHGNGYGFWYGPVGDGTTQNQVNALNVFGIEIHASSRFFGEVGVPNTGPFFTTYGDVGNASNFFNIFGTVHAPSERGLKVDERPIDDAGAIIDAVPSHRWRWDPMVRHDDKAEHAGPMVDDIDEVAPWLVRHNPDPESVRMLQDRDLIGVLWAALREERQHTADLERRLILLESRV